MMKYVFHRKVMTHNNIYNRHITQYSNCISDEFIVSVAIARYRGHIDCHFTACGIVPHIHVLLSASLKQ